MAFGVMTCKVGDKDGVGFEGTGDSFFKGENRSKSSKVNCSISLETGGTGGVEGFTGDSVSILVRLRFAAGVCDEETDGDRDRCLRVFVELGPATSSIWIGSVSSTTHCFSFVPSRSYSASDTKGVNLDFGFFADD